MRNRELSKIALAFLVLLSLLFVPARTLLAQPAHGTVFPSLSSGSPINHFDAQNSLDCDDPPLIETTLPWPEDIHLAVSRALCRRPAEVLPGEYQNLIATSLDLFEDDTWAFATIVMRSDSMPPGYNSLLDFDNTLALARRTESGWQVTFEGLPGFKRLAGAAPPTVISESSRPYFLGEVVTTTTSSGLPGSPGLKWPWKGGQTWQYTQGPHAYNSALDFAPPSSIPETERYVVAAASGAVVAKCEDHIQIAIRLSYASGYSIGYLHIDRTSAPFSHGDSISQGTILGYTYNGNYHGTLPDDCRGIPNLQFWDACGCGQGPHVHFYARYNGEFTSIIGSVISGWELGSDGCFTKDGTQTKYCPTAWITSDNYADTTPPTVSFNTPATSRWYNSDQTLSWDISDDGSGVDYFRWEWDDNSPDHQVSGSHGSTTLSAAGQGRHTLYVQAWDKRGNATDPPASRGWFGYDTQVPSISFNAPTANTWYNSDRTISWSITDGTSGVDYFRWEWDDISPDIRVDADHGSTTLSAAGQGKHTVYVQAWDEATNHTHSEPRGWFGYDTQPPSNPTSVDSGCAAANNVWQNDCHDPNFTWSGASDGVGIGVQDYHYYWGDDPSGAPNTYASNAGFDPPAVSGDVAVRYLRVATRDQLNQESSPATLFVLRYDAAPPTVTVTINDGAETANQVDVRLTLAASDTGSGVGEMCISDGPTCDDWRPYEEEIIWSLPALDRRTLGVYVRVRDRAGNESTLAADTVYLDLYPPMPHSDNFRICANVIDSGGSAITSTGYALVSAIGQPWATGAQTPLSSGFLAGITGCLPITRPWTSNYTVTQWVIASGGNLRGSTSYRLGDTTGQPAASGGTAFSSTHYLLSSGFWAQITGTVPTTSTPPAEPTPTPTPGPTPTPAPTPTPVPSGFGVSIEDGALYTNDPLVQVRLWAPNVTEMRLSNDGGYSDEGWQTYRVTTTWTISTYGEYVLPRYVYVWFRDADGIVYGAYFDDIIYDPVPPRGQVRIVLPDTLRPQATTTVTLLLDGYDDNSGISDVRIWEQGQERTAAAWQVFTDTLAWNWQGGVVYAQFRDSAGNESAIYGSDGSEYALDQAPQSVTLSGPDGGFVGQTYTFTVQVQPLTATQPITYIWGATGHPTVTHAARMSAADAMTYTWTTTGPQTVTVRAMNALGRESGRHTIRVSELTASVEKSVTPMGTVVYGDELTYTLAISGTPGSRVGVYDPLEGLTFVRFVTPVTGITHTGNIITGTVTLTPTTPITVSFVAHVGVPNTVGWTVDVSNKACVYPAEQGTLLYCVWSNTVTNKATRPEVYGIYLPLVLRNR